MRKLVFAVMDDKVSLFSAPVFAGSIGEGSRFFTDAVNDKETLFNRHPEDFSLYHLGYFVPESGLFENCPAPVLVCRAVDCIESRASKLREVN